MNKEQILKKCVERWGKEAQIFMAIEEASELIQALIHHWRGRKGKVYVIEEIADMTLMCEQLAFIFGKRQVEDQMNLKLLRLEERVLDENRKIKM